MALHALRHGNRERRTDYYAIEFACRLIYGGFIIGALYILESDFTEHSNDKKTTKKINKKHSKFGTQAFVMPSHVVPYMQPKISS